jgi:hypothetical protein
MYRIEVLFGDRWAVVGLNGQTECVGTMRQCEDWLDCQENRVANRVKAPSARRPWMADSRNLLRRVAALAISIALSVYVLFLYQAATGRVGHSVSARSASAEVAALRASARN